MYFGWFEARQVKVDNVDVASEGEHQETLSIDREMLTGNTLSSKRKKILTPCASFRGHTSE